MAFKIYAILQTFVTANKHCHVIVDCFTSLLLTDSAAKHSYFRLNTALETLRWNTYSIAHMLQLQYIL